MNPQSGPLHWLGIEQSPVSHAERLLSALGGFLGILGVCWVTSAVVGGVAAIPIIASMGASAVLLYAVPHGALSQPWPVIGGHLLSAVVGVACQRWIGQPAVAAALAVGLAIGAMHYLRCLHPPGGATAITAVIGGEAIHALGFGYALLPVGLNLLIILGIAVAFNAPLRWRRYPVAWARRDSPPAPAHLALQHEDFAAALKSIDSFIDVDEDDLKLIFSLAEEHARQRRLQAGAHVRGSTPTAAAAATARRRAG